MKLGTLHRQLAALLLVFAVTDLSAADTETEIRYLLEFVSDSGCTFIRNGTSHDALDAADHLRLKYKNGRRYADTAEHFIDRLASRSSWSGDAYTVDCDGRVETSDVWLYRALADYRRNGNFPAGESHPATP